MDMWKSYAADGREVVIRRKGGRWKVRCGESRAENTNLDIALLLALRAEPEVVAHHRELDYPGWIRKQADAVDSQDD